MRVTHLAVVVALTLAACSSSDTESGAARPEAPAPVVASPTTAVASAAHIPTQEQLDQYLAEGPEPTLRKIASVDYWLQYQLMQATGIEQELGGETQAVAALKALGDAYERRLRAADLEMPRWIPTMTGEGLTSGFTGMGIGSFISTVTGGLLASAVSSMSDEQVAAYNQHGPFKSTHDGGSTEMTVAPDGSLTNSIEMKVNESGLTGTVRTRTRMDACPNADGRVTLDIEVDSQMAVTAKPGVGGSMHSEFHYERYLDDDAHLITTADGSASNTRIRMSGQEGKASQSADMSLAVGRDGKYNQTIHAGEGFSSLRLDEGKRAGQLFIDAQMLQTLMAEALMRGLGSKSGSPWEGGRCVNLKIISDPARRTRLRPNTAFDIQALPRVKSDGSAAKGTVTATLTGGSHLQPGGKVKADAKFEYAGPAEKDETASIYFEARSKRGVGKATANFDTKTDLGYLMQGGAAGIHFKGHVCNLEQSFTLRSDNPLNDVKITFEPASKERGTYTYAGKMSGFDDQGNKYTFPVHGKGKYDVKFAEEVAVSVTASGPGTVETPYGPQNGSGTEAYTLKPLGEQPCAGER